MPAPSTEVLLQKAREVSGLSDFGDDWFMGPLAAYASDLDSPHLSEAGTAFLTRLVQNDLVRRLRIINCLKQNPEIEDTPIPPIVYITGHERSGTTLLHNLMSLHGQARFLSRWELMAPTPPPEAANFATDGRQAKVQKSVDALRGSDLEYMHWVNADEPEECVWGFMDCTGLLGMAPGMILPNWYEWLQSNDLTPTFVNYRKIIQILTWKNPVPRDGFLVLKAPQMATNLDAFSGVFPEANFVYIHRDPYRVLNSFCTLINIVNGPFLQDSGYMAKREQQGSRSLERMAILFRHMEQFEVDHPGRVTNVHYQALLDSPVAQVSGLFRQLNCPVDDELEFKIENFLSHQKAGGRARPRDELDDFGYRRQDLLGNPPIAHYLLHYGVGEEITRRVR
ncbi:MAG: sulfotransferase [Halieaceae bacterium]|jgi:hypothetical protein|nr:sulfotransferase [Halieaceae bacterium]